MGRRDRVSAARRGAAGPSRGLLTAGLALALLGSCAPLPAPAPAGAPVAPRPAGPATPPPVSGPFELSEAPTIDVGLAWDLGAVELRAGPRATLSQTSGPSARSRGVVKVSLAGTGARIENRRASETSGEEGRLEIGDTLWVGDPDSPSDSLVRWNGKTWRGRLKIFLNPRGKLTVVDRLPLETYLLGVVPGEIGALDPKLLEAGRAQAIAARSYTLFYRGRRAAEGFDLFGTVEDQLYGPAESERPLATRCVETTRGEIALSQGYPIRANYCSTCGGITADVWEAWPTESLPYLVSHLDRGDAAGARTAGSEPDFCAASPQYRWREQWSAAEFDSNLARFGKAQGLRLPPGGPGELLDVTVDRRSRSGRVWSLTVATTRGDLVIPAYSIRQVLRRGGAPSSILRSNLFKIDVRRDPATRRALAVVASGAGSGHGVGLCQTGALGMARGGKSAREILEHYYRGAEVKRLY